MSTMCLTDETFINIKRTLEHTCHSRDEPFYYLNLHYLNNKNRDGLGRQYNKNNKAFYGFERLVGVWRANNIRAYNARYSDYKNKFFKFQRNAKGKVLTPVQLLKTLECLQYNSDNHYDKSLNFIIDKLTSCIVSNLEDYKTAKWG